MTMSDQLPDDFIHADTVEVIFGARKVFTRMLMQAIEDTEAGESLKRFNALISQGGRAVIAVTVDREEEMIVDLRAVLADGTQHVLVREQFDTQLRTWQ
jgi:hypothetical protein